MQNESVISRLGHLSFHIHIVMSLVQPNETVVVVQHHYRSVFCQFALQFLLELDLLGLGRISKRSRDAFAVFPYANRLGFDVVQRPNVVGHQVDGMDAHVACVTLCGRF